MSDFTLMNSVKRHFTTGAKGPFNRRPTVSAINSWERKKRSGEISGVRPFLSTIVHSGRFESLIALVILFNAALMYVQANHDIQNTSSPPNEVVHRIELVLHIIYAVELALRLVVHGCEYFVDINWRWNWFDMLLVVMSVYDQIVNAMAVDKPGFNLSFFRMLRLLKMVKLLRVIRLMRFFKELRLILNAVMGGMQAMFWACVLIAIISYIAGILFVQASAQYLRETGEDIPQTRRELIHEYFGGVGTAMLSLLIACTNGEEWTAIAAPLRDAGSVWYGLFVAYIAFFEFVIMNTLTSLFVDTVMDHSLRDLEMVIHNELERKGDYINMLQSFFKAIDSNNHGFITIEDFEDNLEHPVIQGFAATLDIDVTNAKKFFRYLSQDGSRQVDVETFVVGCIKLKGNARSVDLIEHNYTFKKYISDSALFIHETTSRLKSMERFMKNLHIQIAAAPRDIRLLSL